MRLLVHNEDRPTSDRLTMLYDVSTLLFLLAIAAADTNSHQSFKSTSKPDILIERPLLPKPFNPPTHISEFTDPDTGLNPFLDLEEGATFLGRNIMKDETRHEPPFMDFNIMEGDGSNRQWMELGVPKEPIEEPISRWIPFEEEVKLEDFNFQTTVQTYSTDIDQIISLSPTTSDYEEVHSGEVYEDYEQKVTEELQVSNAIAIYATVAIIILAIALILLGGCWWKRRFRPRTTQSPTAMENGELKC